MLLPWYIALASVDRSRSVTLRAWSNTRIATRICVLIIPFIVLGYIYVPIEFKNIISGRVRCPANQGSYPTFYGIWNLIIFSWGPSFIMLTFGSLTIRHVRQSRRRIAHQQSLIETQLNPSPIEPQSKRLKSTDQQLIRMMLRQCFYLTIMSTPVSISWIYTSTKYNNVADTLQTAKDNFFTIAASVISLTGACTSFYIFTWSSQLFRRELMQLFHRCRGLN
ncbi:hypothetical protein I4U23_015663 [Adineta vaga]|nr:hypothetical protein I4U23_015663 [Adineta vaga]